MDQNVEVPNCSSCGNQSACYTVIEEDGIKTVLCDRCNPEDPDVDGEDPNDPEVRQGLWGIFVEGQEDNGPCITVDVEHLADPMRRALASNSCIDLDDTFISEIKLPQGTTLGQVLSLTATLEREKREVKDRLEELEALKVRLQEKIAELVKERNNAWAQIEILQARPSVELCEKNRAEGRGPCGACALCCREQYERAEELSFKVRELQESLDARIDSNADLRDAERRIDEGVKLLDRDKDAKVIQVLTGEKPKS